MNPDESMFYGRVTVTATWSGFAREVHDETKCPWISMHNSIGSNYAV